MACKQSQQSRQWTFEFCFIKILQHPLGWKNLDRTIAYTRFHRRTGGGGVVSILYFVIQPYIFMLVKRLLQLQFCLDKADKPQVMFYFPEIK